jgi:predicted RNase H-like HicB family nuclease
MAFTAKIRVELVWDASVGRWDFDVPELRVLGTGGATKEEALRRAAEAIAFALDGEANTAAEGADVAYLPVAVGS